MFIKIGGGSVKASKKKKGQNEDAEEGVLTKKRD